MKVSLHTSLKHRILGVYFNICKNVMKSKQRGLFYVDLYSGDGICHCDNAPMREWYPPYFSLLKYAERDNLDLKCIFNDKDKDKIENLLDRLKPYMKYVMATFSEDANIVYRKILDMIPPNEWSIFLLDPFNHSQLHFTTIEEISKHSSFDSRSGCVRRPEMIINFMTYSMQQYIRGTKRRNISPSKKEKLLATIDRSLGTDIWREKILIKNKSKNGEKVHQILLNIFINQLSKLGYDTVYFSITQTTAKENVIYYLIFATSIPKAYRIISQRFSPWIKKVKKEKWIKENFSFYKKAIARERGLKLLEDFS